MTIETNLPEERADLKKRQELQQKLQEAIRRSASSSELGRIQQEIERLNKKIEEHAHRINKVG